MGRSETLDLDSNGKIALVKLEKWSEAHKGRVQDHLLTVDQCHRGCGHTGKHRAAMKSGEGEVCAL